MTRWFWAISLMLSCCSLGWAEERPALHPKCLEELAQWRGPEDPPEKESISLKECNARHAEIPLEMRDGYLESHDAQSGYDDVSAYKVTGRTPSGDEVVVMRDYGGGSGGFSMALIVHREKRSDGDATVTAKTIRIGVDRCLGFIEDAQVNKAGDYVFEQTITPAGLIEAVAPSEDGLEASDCYQCCIGTRKVIQHKSGAEKIVALTIERLSRNPTDACVNKAIQQSAPKFPYTLPASEFGKLQRALKACVPKN